MRLRSVRRGGFTLVEIMVVVVIIGIMAATVIPMFKGTQHDAKVGTAKATISELDNALERFHANLDRYPTMEEGLRVLVEAPATDAENWRGPYIKMLRQDPWKNAYQYRAPGVHHADTFDLWSRGGDGVDGGEGRGADIGNWE